MTSSTKLSYVPDSSPGAVIVERRVGGYGAWISPKSSRADLRGELVGVAPVLEALRLGAEQRVEVREAQAGDVGVLGEVMTLRPSIPTCSSM